MTPRLLAVSILMWAVGGTARAEVNLDIYAEVDYSLRVQSDTTNQFAVPKVSFLYTQTYGKLSFLAEPLLEVVETNDFIIDLDRLEISYAAEEWLRLKFGRFHSSVGYYNDEYHHAAIFMPSIVRPLMVEDSGLGLIPGFSVGVHADGRIRVEQALAIRYDVELANARGRNPDQAQSLFDLQNEKEFVLRLRIEPGGALDGLIIGGNLVLNWIPSVQVVLTGEDSPELAWLAATFFGVSARTLLTKIKQEVFKAEMTRPISVENEQDTIEKVKANKGGIGVVSAAAAKSLPPSVAVTQVQQ